MSKMKEKSEDFYVVIIGRPNVGKSSLLNRLAKKRRALVHNLPGVTRDRLEVRQQWIEGGEALSIVLIDTGGLEGSQGKGAFSTAIGDQVLEALKKANLVLFVLDAQTGVTTLDQELLLEIQKKKIFEKTALMGVVNKVDTFSHEDRACDFYELGIDILTLSAEMNRGIETLKSTIFEIAKNQRGELPSEIIEDSKIKIPRIAIVGRPNVGKSTLMNTILKENRVVASPIAGTTIDSVDTLVEWTLGPIILVDTAGIRRKSKTQKGVEVLSVIQAKKTLKTSDLAILVLDGSEGTHDQDEKIAGLIEEAGCGLVLFVNKWDTQRRNTTFTPKIAEKQIRNKMRFLNYAPMVFGSALEDHYLDRLAKMVQHVLRERDLRISTHELTQWIQKEILFHNPRNAKVYLSHQTTKSPPTFVCHVNDPEKFHFSLKRHLVNALRLKWGYLGSPIRFHFVSGKSKNAH
jgi:GTP-binding protein